MMIWKLPVMVSPPLYGSELIARSTVGRVRCVLRLNSVRASLLYWTTPTRVLSSPIWKALAVAEMKLRMYLKLALPTLQEPSTKKTRSATELTEHSGKNSKKKENKSLEMKRINTQVAEMSFYCRVASEIGRGGQSRRSQLRWFRHLVRMLPREVFLDTGDPETDPEDTGEVTFLTWPGNTWAPPRGAAESGRGEDGLAFSTYTAAHKMEENQMGRAELYH